MKVLGFSLIALFSILTLGNAATLQSKPFFLSLKSDNSSINGKMLSSCHEGALIQGLCISPGAAQYRTFYLNATAAHPNTGLLVYNNIADGTNGKDIVSQSMTFVYNAGSNIAGLIFDFAKPNIYMSFDSTNRMYVDVTKQEAQGVPNNYSPIHLYRWHMCVYPFEGYTYEELVWQLGEGPLIYEDCSAVEVTRVFRT